MYWLFKDESQMTRAIQTLATRAELAFTDGLTTGHKPSERFWKLIDGLGQLSHGEQVLLRFMQDMWNGDGKVWVAELFDLDAGNQALVLGLLGAMSKGPAAVEQWIESGPAKSHEGEQA